MGMEYLPAFGKQNEDGTRGTRWRTGHGWTKKTYVGDEEYDGWGGQVVAERREKLGVTDDGWVIVRVTQLIDVGRRPKPRLTTDALTPEMWWTPPPPAETVEERLEEFFRKHGPATIDEIAAGCRLKRGAVAEHFAKKRGRVRCLARRKGLWGLPEERDNYIRMGLL